MTNNNKNAKVLKSLMVGTIALTPVLATGIGTVQAASSSNEDVSTLIKDLNAAYDKLSQDDKDLLVAAHGKIEGQLSGQSWETYLNSILTTEVTGNPTRQAAAEKVVQALVTFLASSTTGYNMEQAFKTFDQNINDSDLTTAFGQTITKGQFIAFLVDVQKAVLMNTDNKPYLEKFIKALNDTANKASNKNIYDGIWNSVHVLKVGDVLNTIIVDANILPEEKVAFVNLSTEYKKIVDAKPPVTPPDGGGSGGGGGGVIIPPTPPVTGGGSVEVDGSTITSNPQAVIDSINNADAVKELTVKVPAGATNVDVPATILNALDNKNSKAVVALQFGEVAYELPVNAFDLSAAAKDLDVASAELNLVVTVKKVDNPLQAKAAYKVLADAIDFEVKLVAPNNKSVTLSVFPTPIKRTLPATAKLNPQTTVGVTIDANGKVTAVPTYVSGDKVADLYRSTNSVYTLIEYSKSFTDLTGGTSWAEAYVNKLASRMVVNGKTDTTFAPTLKITRGEFAAILSRGLGIVAMDPEASSFKDVSPKQAFNQNGEIAAVVEAGIVSGYSHDTFRPYEEITRDQAAIMISRAIDYVGADKVTFDKTKALTAFTDNKQIGAASRKHVERVYQAGLLDGYLDDTFRPTADANRAQMAKIIYNFLAEIEFIN